MNLLLDDMKLVIMNEWQAASLRLEKVIEKTMREAYLRLAESAQAVQKDWAFGEPSLAVQEEFLQQSPLQNVSARDFKEELRLFKGTNAFFEKDGRKAMERSVYDKLETLIDEYYTEQKKSLLSYAEYITEALGEQLTSSMLADGAEIVSGLKQMLEEQSNPAAYEQAAERLGSIMKREGNDRKVDTYTRT